MIGLTFRVSRGELGAVTWSPRSGRRRCWNCLPGLDDIDGSTVRIDGWGRPGGGRTMTATPTEEPVSGPVDSLEVRWIVPGQPGTAMREWFARFPAGTEAREDSYLFRPRLRGLSVKLRGGIALDVKSYLGSPGILDLPRQSRGRLEYWRKWSFPCGLPAQGDTTPAGWVIVRKRRRNCWFPLAKTQDPARSPQSAVQTGCAVELTEANVRGGSWWSVGFEATGSAGMLPGALQHAAALVFAQALPAGVEFSLVDSRSYAQWLSQRPGLDAEAPAHPE